MSDNPRTITKRVIAVFPHILEPDTKGNKPSNKYCTQFKFVEDADREEFQEWLKKAAKEMLPRLKKPKVPGTHPKDKDKNVLEDEWQFRASSKHKPAVFDSRNKPLPKSVTDISGGSVLRLNIAAGVLPDKDGICLYLNQVQVIDLKVWERGSGFDEIDDGYEAAEDAEPAESGSFGGSASPADDDAIPF